MSRDTAMSRPDRHIDAASYGAEKALANVYSEVMCVEKILESLKINFPLNYNF